MQSELLFNSPLLYRVSLGDTVIVLIGNGTHWQHLITFVGYKKKDLYFYDSRVDIDENDIPTNIKYK